ncbi:MAG: carboxymuconolactone decarboxylase family protein [Anaerolineales bacterium]|nr:carboxymuconolactone decarboxylase family protein [Anaerolineales bacterium]
MTMLEISPDLNQRFVDFYRAAFADGTLDRKTKQLIGLAVALAVGCGP